MKVTYVSVSGLLGRVVNLAEPAALEPFTKLVGRFRIPRALVSRAKVLKVASPAFPTTPRELVERLLDRDWRFFPLALDVPAGCQDFGRLAVDAGIEGVVYPSTRASEGKHCLAVFPQNVAESSWVALDDPAPSAVSRVRLDHANHTEFLE